jgi:hypothetical protein
VVDPVFDLTGARRADAFAPTGRRPVEVVLMSSVHNGLAGLCFYLQAFRKDYYNGHLDGNFSTRLTGGCSVYYEQHHPFRLGARMKPIPEGTSDELVVETTPEMGVKHLPVPMYSTPTMVGHFEQLCLTMMIPFLNSGESSVGYKVDIKHTAPTPIGMKVTIKERRAIDMSRFTGKS